VERAAAGIDRAAFCCMDFCAGSTPEGGLAWVPAAALGKPRLAWAPWGMYIDMGIMAGGPIMGIMGGLPPIMGIMGGLPPKPPKPNWGGMGIVGC